MPVVWIREDPKFDTRFHSSPDCKQLRKISATGHSRDLVARDLNDVHVRPCKTCYPDAPRLDIIKRYCEECRSRYACEHNGGVYVTLLDGRRRWVWPDSNQMPLYRTTS